MRNVRTVLTGGLLIVVALVGCGGSKTDPTPTTLDQLETAKKISNDEARAKKLLSIGEQLMASHDITQASKAADLARAAADEMGDPATQVSVYSQLARLQKQTGDSRDAQATLKAALESAPTIESPAGQARALVQIAASQAAIGRRSDAKATLSQAKQTVESLETPDAAAQEAQALIMASLAASYHAAKSEDDAQEVIAAALAATGKIEDPRSRVRAIAGIALEMAQMGKKSDAEGTFTMAIDEAKKQTDPEQQAYALIDVANSLNRAKRGGQANQALADAETAAKTIKANDVRKLLETELQTLRKKGGAKRG